MVVLIGSGPPRDAGNERQVTRRVAPFLVLRNSRRCGRESSPRRDRLHAYRPLQVQILPAGCRKGQGLRIWGDEAPLVAAETLEAGQIAGAEIRHVAARGL